MLHRSFSSFWVIFVLLGLFIVIKMRQEITKKFICTCKSPSSQENQTKQMQSEGKLCKRGSKF